ncbi:MAG: glycosyltransferase [Defluviitaleaceae bacterium]|nr:glycosyltransferase [Defluviitaleaceae bacterium]
MRTVSISIITAVFNGSSTISKTITSVLEQTLTPLEYIIIDGASSDNTLEIAESFRRLFDERGIRYLIVSEADKGIYDAMNKGIALAEGEIIGMINSDDWYEPTAIQTVKETYAKKPFDMFWADVRLISPKGVIIKNVKEYPITTRYWHHSSTFITKEIYSEDKHRCESIYDDFELHLRLRRKNVRTATANKVVSNFCFGGVSNEKSIKKTIERIKLKYSIYRTHGYNRLYLFECMGMEIAKYLFS